MYQTTISQNKTKQALVVYIKELADHLGFTPTKKDIPVEKMVLIKQYYTAWIKIICDADLESFSTVHQRMLRRKRLDVRLAALARVYIKNPKHVRKKEYILLKSEYIQTKRCPEEFKPIDRTSDRKTIQAYLKALAEELGYTPTMPMTMGCKQITKKYGNWFNALDAAGLERSNTEHQEALRAQINNRRFDRLLRSICQEDINKKKYKEYA